MSKSASVFPYSKWNGDVALLARQYRENAPYPHILAADFLEPAVARLAAEEFSDPSAGAWTQYKHQNENKLGMAKRALFPPLLGQIADELNSPQFVGWLSQLTGIPSLVSDDLLEGGGLHQSSRGGFLNVHTDFSHHHYRRHWRRRVNLILYLNPEWDEQWGGAIELWDRGMRHCAVRYLPLLNHVLIFNTDERSLHGFPEPLECPENVSRKSLALYYYTVEQDEHATGRSNNRATSHRATNYRARPQDGVVKAALIWLDKQAVNLYSRAKARFGFSDEFASRVLGIISKMISKKR